MNFNITNKILVRRALLFLLVSAVVITAVSMYSKMTYIQPTDCEIARIWYDINPNTADSFEMYLEEQFRIGDIVEMRGLFKGPRFSIAIRHPDNDNLRLKGYDFLISREGEIYSQRSISITIEEWSWHRKIICRDAHGERK